MQLFSDGRADSPGHCAKFHTYTCIDSVMKKVLTFHVVQSNETGGAYHCELEGLRRSLGDLGRQFINMIVTDCHRQIAKWLRDNYADIIHLFDIWHVAKAVGKKIDAAAKKRECAILSRWKKAIVHHLFWSVCSTALGSGELVAAKWKSVVEHLHNRHEGFDNPLYTACQHPPEVGERPWLQPATPASVELEKIVTRTGLVNDIKKLSPEVQTSSLESFHAVMLSWVPKKTSYSFKGMYAR